MQNVRGSSILPLMIHFFLARQLLLVWSSGQHICLAHGNAVNHLAYTPALTTGSLVWAESNVDSAK
jgi:hypothetical protein